MAKLKPKRQQSVRNRVVEQRSVRAGDLSALQDHPLNWRLHDAAQKRTMDDLYGEVGFVKPVDVYVPNADDSFVTEGVEVGGQRVLLKAGVPVIMDGHLRRERLPEDFVLTLNVTDLTQAEALKYLATCDPLASLAGQDDARLTQLLSDIDSDSAAVQEMLGDLIGSDDDESDGDSDEGGSTFQILVMCKGEDEQRELISEFLTRGIDHKALLA